MTEDEPMNEERRRLDQNSLVLIEHRLTQLENERLPHRVAAAEQTLEQMKSQVEQITEITRGLGVTMSAEFKELSTSQMVQVNELRSQQQQFMAFAKGIMWVGGIMVTFIGLAPVFRELVRHWASA